jgi:hypothetical protein
LKKIIGAQFLPNSAERIPMQAGHEKDAYIALWWYTGLRKLIIEGMVSRDAIFADKK